MLELIRSAAMTLGSAAYGLVTASGGLQFAVLKHDPDGAAVGAILLRIALAGMITQAGYLLSRVGRDKPMPWPRWLGEIFLGGLAAWLLSAMYFSYGPPVTVIQLSIAGVFGGFFGQRLIVALFDWFGAKVGIKIAPQKDGEDSGRP